MLRQVERLGFEARDVTDIIVTHLDFDHAGGLDDFPNATVHLHAAEERQATRRTTLLERQRFRPKQWGSTERFRTYVAEGEAWFGFQAVRALTGLPPELLLVPLIGHTEGHCGVAVQKPEGGWLLHCGDAYFHHGEMNVERPYCPPGLRAYQWLMDTSRNQRVANQKRLRGLVARHSDDVTVCSAHDVEELEQLRAPTRVHA